MGETEDCFSKSFKEVDNSEAVSGYERRVTKTIIKTIKNETEFKDKLIKNYNEHFNKETKASDILINKRLFFDCLFFITDSLKEKQKREKISWSFFDEFILVFTSNLSQKFLIEQIKSYQLRLCSKEESIISVTRNKKIHNYLIFSREELEGTSECELEKFLHFEHFLKELKHEIVQCCSKERKLFENLGRPRNNIFLFESYLKERKMNKKVMADLFEKGFHNPHYLNNQEFTYIYLTYMIVFCKSIHRTSEKIQQKFRIPLKRHHEESNSFYEQPVLVCCGTNDRIGYTLGEVLISNVVFRKMFGVCKSNTLNKNINISDMIPDWSQKENHIELFLRSYKKEPKVKKNHSAEKCFLKVNLMTENFHIFQEFKISTKVFYTFEKALSFICVFERISLNQFVLERDLRKLEERIPIKTKTTTFRENIIINHSQLNQEMELILLNHEEIGTYLPEIYLEETRSARLMESSNHDLVRKETDVEFQKFSRIENLLSDNEAKSEPFTLKIVVLSIIPFILAFCGGILISHIFSNRSKDSMNFNQEISDALDRCQGCQVRYSSYLYLLKKMQEGRIDNSSCNPFYENLQETIINFIENCDTDRLPNFFKDYFMQEMATVPILDTKLIESLGVEASYMSSSGIDYFNYLYSISQFSKTFYKSDLINLSDEDETLMKDFIRKNVFVGKNSFSRMFNNKLGEINIKYLKGNELKFNITVICGILFVLLLFIISFCCLIKVFQRVLIFLNLLTKLDLNFLKQRVYEMKFICHEVEKVNDFSFRTCSFPSDFEIKVETCTYEDSTSENFLLNQFEKQAEAEFTEKEEAEEQNDILSTKERDSIVDVMMGKKWVFLSMVLFCVILMSLLLLIALQNRDVLKNGYRMARIIKEGGIGKEILSSINYESWTLYFNDTSIHSIETTFDRFEEYKNFLLSQPFSLEIYDSFDSSILNKTAYLNICELLERHDFMTKDKCERKLKNLSSMRSSDMLSFVVNIENEGYQNFKENAILPNISTICQSMYLNRKFLSPSLRAEWKELLESINSSFIEKAEQMTFILILAGFIFTFAFIAIVITNYANLVRFTKPEVLTMDTVHDLYGIPSFRPHLNNIDLKKCYK